MIWHEIRHWQLDPNHHRGEKNIAYMGSFIGRRKRKGEIEKNCIAAFWEEKVREGEGKGEREGEEREKERYREEERKK